MSEQLPERPDATQHQRRSENQDKQVHDSQVNETQASQTVTEPVTTLPPVYRNPNRFLLLLPWLLLTVLLLIVFWLFTHNKLTPTPLQPPLNNNAAVTEWQPPKPNPVAAPTLSNQQDVVSYHNAVSLATQSVVNIYTTQKVAQHPYMSDPDLRRFFEQHGGVPDMEGDNTSLGSGVIVSPDGYIVTNAHVISQADNIVVMLSDGRKAAAKLVGADPESDLAVIKVPLTGLKPLGFKEQVTQVGDVVLAIGNPFGVGQTVTQGIISATGRSGLGINTVEDFIQTDAAINPGNSGGALIDAHGQLVGINTAIFSRSGGSMGIGFAIPTNIIEYVMTSLIKEGKVRRGWLGIELQGREKDPTNLDASTGIEVMSVLPDGPAAKSGMKKGDIILAMDGKSVNDANTLIQLVARQLPNTVIKLRVKRGDNEADINVTLGERQPQQTLQQLQGNQSPLDNYNDIPEYSLPQRPDGSLDEERIPPELLELFKNK
jgi:serine protease DegS